MFKAANFNNIVRTHVHYIIAYYINWILYNSVHLDSAELRESSLRTRFTYITVYIGTTWLHLWMYWAIDFREIIPYSLYTKRNSPNILLITIFFDNKYELFLLKMIICRNFSQFLPTFYLPFRLNLLRISFFQSLIIENLKMSWYVKRNWIPLVEEIA